MPEMKSGVSRIVVASQIVQWLAAHCLWLRFAVERHAPPELFVRAHEHCLILAPTHKSMLDPWLIASALSYRQWRSLVPVRFLATTTFGAPLKWLMPLVLLFYRLTGAIALPPKKEGGGLPEKVQGQLEALQQGDVVMIFPEGGLWKKSSPPVGPFAHGAVYLQRQSGAAIVPMAVWMEEPRWPRRRYILEIGQPVFVPDSLDLDAGAGWLRERVLELHERAARRARVKADDR
jgi:1-acyl-sn-glycerol-3-phosphate acyltransferase